MEVVNQHNIVMAYRVKVVSGILLPVFVESPPFIGASCVDVVSTSGDVLLAWLACLACIQLYPLVKVYL